jgi:hypothetical protein
MTKFADNNPGGPGRPRGSRNRLNKLLDEMAGGHAEELLRKMIDDAQGDDHIARRALLNRVWKGTKGRPVALDLPEIRTAADLVAAHAVVLEGVASGEMSPEEAEALTSVFETYRRAFELVAQESRIVRLEKELRMMKRSVP